MADVRYMTAREAADALEISVASLYAYVSRGLIRSESDGASRQRRYLAEDIQTLKQRKEQRRDPVRVVEQALHWGTPVLDSAITLIANNQLYYRGHNVVDLARTRSVEEVAALIWSGDFATRLFEGGSAPPAPALPPGLLPIDAFQTVLPLVARLDLAAYDLHPATVARTGARILSLLTAVAAGSELRGGIAATLQCAWAADNPAATAAISMALILCADHELNVSSFTARCVASARSTPYAVVIAGLAALQGTRHGRETERVTALLREISRPDRTRIVLSERLQRGESIPGFGHPLYPGGDPRGRMLLEYAAAHFPDAPAVELARVLSTEVWTLFARHPSMDLGLAVLADVLGLPTGAPLGLFALGRTIGWIGHAIEQYAEDKMIRPRARYVGPAPGPTHIIDQSSP